MDIETQLHLLKEKVCSAFLTVTMRGDLFSIVPSLDLVSNGSSRDDHNHYDQCPFSLTQTLSFHTLKFGRSNGDPKTQLSHEHQKACAAKIVKKDNNLWLYQ